MEETNQNSQTSLDFNSEKFEPKNESEIQEIIKYISNIYQIFI